MNIVVIGAQWGDEGKGKIVDFLADRADIVVRFSGGANAGHTIVNRDKTYKLHLIPSGVVYPNKTVVLGTGMVVDPEALFDELNTIEKQGISWKNRVFISDRAHIVMPKNKLLDIENDKNRKNPIGTTGRGIGTTYSLKALRDGIRICDILDEDFFNNMENSDREFVLKYRDRLKKMTIDISSFQYKNKNKNILFEGAQGILLDLDIGTYPYVSSGVSAAAGASVGGGIGPRDIDTVLGVFKAYTTRVGNGPFPSEFLKERDGNLESQIREIGREYGVTTGRPRRCGYLDLVALRYACRTNSITHLVLTHLDVYDDMDEIQACVSYKYRDDLIESFPSSISILRGAKPVTKSFKGWKKSLSNCETYEDLPVKAKEYIDFIEEYTETKIGIVSVGYKRTQTIIRKDPWIK